MFHHERGFFGKRREVAEVGLVVHHAFAGGDFEEVDIIFGDPLQVFGVAGGDPRAQGSEEIVDQFAVVVKAFRRVDGVADVHVDAEGFAVHRFDEAEVGIGAVGDAPGHHFDGEERALRFDGVEDVATVFHGGIEEFL